MKNWLLKIKGAWKVMKIRLYLNKQRMGVCKDCEHNIKDADNVIRKANRLIF